MLQRQHPQLTATGIELDATIPGLSLSDADLPRLAVEGGGNFIACALEYELVLAALELHGIGRSKFCGKSAAEALAHIKKGRRVGVQNETDPHFAIGDCETGLGGIAWSWNAFDGAIYEFPGAVAVGREAL